MDIKLTRSNQDLKQVSIESLLLGIKKEKQNESSMDKDEKVDGDLDLTNSPVKKVEEEINEQVKFVAGHDSDDRKNFSYHQQPSHTTQQQSHMIKKFDGDGDVEQWLKHIVEKFDLFELTSSERNNLIPNILTGEALIWYVEHQDDMPTCLVFMKRFIQHFGSQKVNQPSQTVIDRQWQMLTNILDKFPTFNGKLKQNVFRWLEELEQAIQIFELTDELKLFMVSLLLEDVARDWFFDNKHLFSTWTSFTEKFIKIFKPPGTIYVPSDQLCLFAHDIKQKAIKSPSESMKLNETTNNSSEQILGAINQHEFMVHPIEDQRIVSSMVNIVSDSISIASAEVGSNSFDSQQIPEINQIGLQINEELPFNAVEFEQSTIQTQEMDFTSTFAESSNTLIVEKLTTIDSSIKVYSELNEARSLFDKHMQIILCQVTNKLQFIRPTTMKMIRIGIYLTIDMHRKVSKMDGFGNLPFDPGGGVMVEHGFGYSDYLFNCSFILFLSCRYLYLSMSKFESLFTFLGLPYLFLIISSDLFFDLYGGGRC
jgi:hypothetical protein